MAKKHISRMTEQELSSIQLLLKGEYFSFSEYCLDRMAKRGIDRREVIKALLEGDIIEYHFTPYNESRVLIRAKGNTEDGCSQVCAVVDLITNAIITCYLNDCDDLHSTLDESNYDPDLSILECLSKSIKSHKYTIFKYNKSKEAV